MRAYFPIPPNIRLKSCEDKILGSITYLNTPNNRLESMFIRKVYKDIVYLGIYHLKNKYWRLKKVIKCEPFEFVEINRLELNFEDHEMVVVVAKKSNCFEEESKILPEPDSLRIDNSIVAQRVSLNFSFLKSTSSYQGEYPLQMARLEKSSFLSFDTLKGLRNKSSQSFLILMNISKNSNSTDEMEVKFFDPKNKDKFKLLFANLNAFTVFDPEKYEKGFNDKETIFLTSKSCTFVPIILTIDLSTYQLSVEHMHPPSEYFMSPRKRELIKIIKSQWLN